MNGKIQVDNAVLRILYFKYKSYLLPVIVFVLSWIAFSQLVFPQVQTFLAQKDQIAANEQTLAVLSQNYNTVVSFNDTSLQQLLDTANQALPSTKDFAGILTAISNAAGVAGVTVNDYSFNVGALNGIALVTPGIEQNITIELTIDGNLAQAKEFIQALSNQLPISQVTSLTQESTSATAISAEFYYNPLPKFVVNGTTPLPIISVAQKQLLEKLAENGGQPVAPVSTRSASPAPSTTQSLPLPKAGTSAAH